MRVSIKKTWSRPQPRSAWRRQSPRRPRRPRLSGMAGAVFMAAASGGGAAAAGMAAGAGPDGEAAGGGGALAGAVVGALAGAVVGALAGAGAAAAGIAAGAGAAVGAGAGIRAGRSQPRPCPSGSRSLRSRSMATVLVAGSGGGFGQPAGTILAGASSTFATDVRDRYRLRSAYEAEAFEDRKTRARHHEYLFSLHCEHLFVKVCYAAVSKTNLALAPKRRAGVKRPPELGVKFKKHAEVRSFAPAATELIGRLSRRLIWRL